MEEELVILPERKTSRLCVKTFMGISSINVAQPRAYRSIDFTSFNVKAPVNFCRRAIIGTTTERQFWSLQFSRKRVLFRKIGSCKCFSTISFDPAPFKIIVSASLIIEAKF